MTKRALLKHNNRFQVVEVLNDTDFDGLALIKAEYSEPFQYIPAPGERSVPTLWLRVNIGELEYLPDDCDCVLPEQSCPACRQKAAEVYGPQEPPSDYRIYNRRREDGTYPPLSEFFEAGE